MGCIKEHAIERAIINRRPGLDRILHQHREHRLVRGVRPKLTLCIRRSNMDISLRSDRPRSGGRHASLAPFQLSISATRALRGSEHMIADGSKAQKHSAMPLRRRPRNAQSDYVTYNGTGIEIPGTNVVNSSTGVNVLTPGSDGPNTFLVKCPERDVKQYATKSTSFCSRFPFRRSSARSTGDPYDAEP
jgi:hypothetical protein